MCFKYGLAAGAVLAVIASGASGREVDVPNEEAGKSPSDGETGEVATRRVYRLSPGDKISIFVAERPDLSAEVRIPLEGTVVLPGAGTSEVAGRGVEELSGDIAERLRVEARLVDPLVAVSVVEYRSRRAFVYGEVARAQAVELPAERPLTLTQAISTCGGFRVEADRNHVRVTRRSGPAASRVFEVDCQKIAEGSEPELDPVLESGDTVYVPTREPVYVLGQVEKPGALPVPYGYTLTVSKAVSMSGGWSKYARYSRVIVTRRTAEGAEVFRVDLGEVVLGEPEKDMVVEPGDTIYVPQRVF